MGAKYEPLSSKDFKGLLVFSERLEYLGRFRCYIEIETTILQLLLQGELKDDSRIRVPVEQFKKQYVEEFAKIYEDNVSIKYIETVEEDLNGKKVRLDVYSCTKA